MDEITPEVLAEAKADGWAEKEQWRGPESAWVDANEFVRRKHNVLPLLRKENEKVNSALQATQQELAALRGNMNEFIKYQQEQTVARLADQRKQLMAEKREADEAGTDARVVEIEEALDENAAARAEAKAPKVVVPTAPAIPPDLAAWQATNEWFGKDHRKTGLAMGLGREAAAKNLEGKAYFDYIDAGMKEVFSPPSLPSKSEGGGPSGGSSGGTGKYASLPAEAKAQCDADAKRFVGPNKMFKTPEAWRENFVKLYFEE